MIGKNEDNIYKNEIQLKKNLSIPSNIHGYSLGIEYMKKWFLDKFDSEYFKSIYVEGKYVFDDLVNLNKDSIINRDKPMLAIVPSINTEYNRETLDLELGGIGLLARRATNYSGSFLQDYEHNQFLGVRLMQIEMNFVFKIRVGSRAQQLDLLEYMKMAYRVGSTQGEDLTMDFHIPNEIIFSIADDVGFQVIQENDRYKVKDIAGFLNYMNSHSQIPVIYKYRAINGNGEFFIKMDNLYTHISNLDAINVDDGEREGMTDNNFHLEMTCILHLPVPHFYFYYTNKELDHMYRERNEYEGLYNLDIFNIEPPAINSKGWRQFLSTEYENDSYHLDKIDFSELLNGNEYLSKVMSYNTSIGLSPSIFMDIVLYNGQKEVTVDIDWKKCIINVNQDFKDKRTLITIYVDLDYINNQYDLIFNNIEDRIGK